ncbi:hypothetical protein RRG08_033548 [Elysia crispata]|uniref:Uncharacterized protein n=1 Tax=Elysia crispata TaxID=231223 RepID=A0AAE0XP58_9GAST|nr:hypothetical protein RRG08_033548 [Elysia crispata]
MVTPLDDDRPTVVCQSGDAACRLQSRMTDRPVSSVALIVSLPGLLFALTLCLSLPHASTILVMYQGRTESSALCVYLPSDGENLIVYKKSPKFCPGKAKAEKY